MARLGGILGRLVTLCVLGGVLFYVAYLAAIFVVLFYPTTYLPYFAPAPNPPPADYHKPIYPVDQRFSLYVYVSPRESSPFAAHDGAHKDGSTTLLAEDTVTTADHFLVGSMLNNVTFGTRSIEFAFSAKNITSSDHFLKLARKESLAHHDDNPGQADHTASSNAHGEYRAYLHAYVTHYGHHADRNAPDDRGVAFDPLAMHVMAPLFVDRPRIVDTTRLLLKDQHADAANGTADAVAHSAPVGIRVPGEIVAHLRRQIGLELIRDQNHYGHDVVPQDMLGYLRHMHDGSKDYLPIFWSNELATKPTDYKPVDEAMAAVSGPVSANDTHTDESRVVVRFDTAPIGWFRLSRQLLAVSEAQRDAARHNHINKQLLADAAAAAAAANGDGAPDYQMIPSNYDIDAAALAASSAEMDKLGRMFYDTDAKLLLITLVASALHIAMRLLTFKEDVSYWSEKESMSGVSRTSISMGTIAAILSTLYVYNKRSETSILVIGGKAAAAGIEVWKLLKVMRPAGAKQRPTLEAAGAVDKGGVGGAATDGRTPSLASQVAQVEVDALTEKVDAITTKLLYTVFIPLLLSYAAYTLVYRANDSYYSWLLDALMATVYSLGFLNMIPQVVVNYKLHSVEAMSPKAFVYKILTTFIDDLFTLVIPMPMLTRVSAFRDDIIFVVLLWQWWRYPSRRADVGPRLDMDQRVANGTSPQDKELRKNE